MSEKITFKKAAEEYLAEETKMGKEKNENAIQQLEWMYKKRPTFIACPVTSRRVRYGLVSRSKHPDYVPIAWDETSGIFEGVDITEITKKDVKAVQKRLLNSRGLSNGCVNSYMSYLRAVLNYANDEMELRFRAPKIVNLPVEERKFILTPQQAKSLIRCLDPLRADLVRMAILTGQRKSNIVLMKWSWIKSDLSEISIPASEMKKRRWGIRYRWFLRCKHCSKRGCRYAKNCWSNIAGWRIRVMFLFKSRWVWRTAATLVSLCSLAR